jgi:hypothetical protein
VHRQLLEQYLRWKVERRLQRLAQHQPLPSGPYTAAKQSITVALGFLTWLQARNRVLEQCEQADVDDWFGSGPTTRQHASPFLKWAQQGGHLGTVEIPAQKIPVRPALGENEHLHHFRSRLPALFSGFAGTTALSDFPWSCITGLQPWPCRCDPPTCNLDG